MPSVNYILKTIGTINKTIKCNLILFKNEHKVTEKHDVTEMNITKGNLTLLGGIMKQFSSLIK